MKTKISILLCAILMMICSCEDWLNVSSDTETVAAEQFSNEAGFRDALIGIYIKLASQSLYGENLTWRCMEFLAQQYALVTSAPDVSLMSYNYSGSALTAYRNEIWSSMYNTIANVNNILIWADKNGDVMHPIQDSIIRGECLALRAYLHLDLMRIFGKGNYQNRPNLANELTIPYSADFSKNLPKQYTYKETFELIFQDIEKALEYLEADPLKSYDYRPEGYYDAVDSDFISIWSSYRQMRLNYYACLALYARALMWEGSSESRNKALEITKQIINPEDITEDTDWYQWVTASELASGDYLKRNGSFIYEHLWSLYLDDFEKYQTETNNGNWFDPSNPGGRYNVIYVNDTRAKYVFEIDAGIVSDWRYTKGLQAEGATSTYYAIVKYREVDPSSKETKDKRYRNHMPLIRITEMFYIAAECLAETNPAEAMKYLNVVRSKRNIPPEQDLIGLSPVQVRDEITKEYMKEFIAEGQLFFYYKRKGLTSIYGYGEDMDDTHYVFPLPDDEIINGGRQQTIMNN